MLIHTLEGVWSTDNHFFLFFIKLKIVKKESRKQINKIIRLIISIKFL